MVNNDSLMLRCFAIWINSIRNSVITFVDATELPEIDKVQLDKIVSYLDSSYIIINQIKARNAEYVDRQVETTEEEFIR